MKNAPRPPATVAEYIRQQDRKTQSVLRKLRAVILKAAPEAEERISYRMPAYFMKGVLVYFAAWEKHIGLYPGARAIDVFKDDIARYVHAKGSIQFPLAKPLPVALVTRIVKFRVAAVKKKDMKSMKVRGKSGTRKDVARKRSGRGVR